jgi:hypothetical protein
MTLIHSVLHSLKNAMNPNNNSSIIYFLQVSQLAVAMSSNEEGCRIVRYAALVIQRLAPQVVNAAFLLADKPNR